METIVTDTRLAIRMRHDGRTDFLDENGYIYQYPDSTISYCECEIDEAKKAAKQLRKEAYTSPDYKIDVVKVTEYVKITKV